MYKAEQDPWRPGWLDVPMASSWRRDAPSTLVKMQSLTLFLALVLLASNAVDAGRFPRAVKGNGFLKVPVGTVERARKSKRGGEDPILTVLDNEDFFYATESRLEPKTKLV